MLSRTASASREDAWASGVPPKRLPDSGAAQKRSECAAAGSHVGRAAFPVRAAAAECRAQAAGGVSRARGPEKRRSGVGKARQGTPGGAFRSERWPGGGSGAGRLWTPTCHARHVLAFVLAASPSGRPGPGAGAPGCLVSARRVQVSGIGVGGIYSDSFWHVSPISFWGVHACPRSLRSAVISVVEN